MEIMMTGMAKAKLSQRNSVARAERKASQSYSRKSILFKIIGSRYRRNNQSSYHYTTAPVTEASAASGTIENNEQISSQMRTTSSLYKYLEEREIEISPESNRIYQLEMK